MYFIGLIIVLSILALIFGVVILLYKPKTVTSSPE
jgi:hypothetical protein